MLVLPTTVLRFHVFMHELPYSNTWAVDTRPALFGCGNAPNTRFEPPFAIVYDPAARRSHSCSPRHCSTSLFPPLRRQSSTPVLYGTIDALRIRSTSATSPRDCSQDPPTLCCVLAPNGHAERTFALRI
ncbi:hypothetical protein B0H21DRAFT_711235 [Amylocystis lapponica]|nr:hypothetical protein B0H21DRAFT_711235 [Amylocystis lapponica]